MLFEVLILLFFLFQLVVAMFEFLKVVLEEVYFFFEAVEGEGGLSLAAVESVFQHEFQLTNFF